MPPVHRGAVNSPPPAASPPVVSPAPISALDTEAELTRLRTALARCQAELESERGHNTSISEMMVEQTKALGASLRKTHALMAEFTQLVGAGAASPRGRRGSSLPLCPGERYLRSILIPWYSMGVTNASYRQPPPPLAR